MTRFKLALSAAIALAAMASMPEPVAAAIEYPWCVQYGGTKGGRNCGFVSYEQCMMTARGAGGMCQQNLFFPGSASDQPQRPRKRHSNY
jgi:hypothetical protein